MPEDVDLVREETEKFLKAHGTTMPTYVDAEGATRRVLASLLGDESIGYPTTVLIDADGVVQGVWQGYSPGVERSMERLVSKLLAKL